VLRQTFYMVAQLCFVKQAKANYLFVQRFDERQKVSMAITPWSKAHMNFELNIVKSGGMQIIDQTTSYKAVAAPGLKSGVEGIV